MERLSNKVRQSSLRLYGQLYGQLYWQLSGPLYRQLYWQLSGRLSGQLCEPTKEEVLRWNG